MRVGIVTINDYTNYGNRLQNYALTKLLENEKIQVVNGIRVFTKESWIDSTENKLKRIIKRFVPFSVLKKKFMAFEITDELLRERNKRFLLFNQSYTENIEPIIEKKNNNVRKVLDKYEIDYFIAGSDQVWNPYYEGKDYEFLSFAPNNKRLSFAASIGSDNIPQNRQNYYKKYLSAMKYISVREEKAAEIVRELTGRTADITLDPTLLLSKNEWDKVVKKPRFQLDGRYVCTYFLGNVPEAVEKYAVEKKISLAKLNDKKSSNLFVLDPAEFLYVIKNAECILTDSFHAVAFSIKFHKQFYVFKREQQGVNDMFSRIETLTKFVGLENRIQKRDKIIEPSGTVAWTKIDKQLESERRNSIGKLLSFLRE